MRAAVFVYVVVVALFSAGAGAVTAVLPVDASGMGADEARVKRDITEVMREVLKQDFKAVADSVVPDGVRCTQTLACLQKAAASVSADEVVWVKAVAATPSPGSVAWSNVSLALFATDGTPLVSFSTVLTTTTTINDLRGIIVQAFAPAQFSGRASVRGLLPGDELLVDGIRPDRPEVTLRAGKHKARVRHGDGTVVEVAFVVPFNDAITVDVPATVPLGGSAPPANWPGLVHASVAGAGLVGVVFLAGREAYLRESAAFLEQSACPVGALDGTGAGFKDQGVASLGACGAVQVEQHQWVQLNRDLHLSLGIGFGVVTLAAGTAAAASYLLSPLPSEG